MCGGYFFTDSGKVRDQNWGKAVKLLALHIDRTDQEAARLAKKIRKHYGSRETYLKEAMKTKFAKVTKYDELKQLENAAPATARRQEREQGLECGWWPPTCARRQQTKWE